MFDNNIYFRIRSRSARRDKDRQHRTHPPHLAEVLGDGARTSGGRHDEIVPTTSVSPALERIADGLLNQYAVTCAVPQGVNANEKLSVTVRRNGINVQAPARLQ